VVHQFSERIVHTMARMLCIFALLGLAVGATPHYGKPPCLSDEVELEVKDFETNYSGKVCAPACGADDSCPTDKPPSAATPKCILHDSGKKYCGLKCAIGCGNGALTCLKLDKTHKVCAYREAPAPPKPKPCCQGKCAAEGKEKYYSIAKSLFGKPHCGECCMDPSKYDLFHFFENNLTKADNDSPCKSFGYTVYDSTDTHGFGPVSMTLDLYNLPAVLTETDNNMTEQASTCAKPGDCGLAYEACCAGFGAKGYPCACSLADGTGNAAADCGTCGTAYSACCAGFAAKGFPCTCDIKDAGSRAFVV